MEKVAMNTNFLPISNLLNELSALSESEIEFDIFLKKVDNFNRESLSYLKQVYGSERFAKVLLLKISNVAVGKYQYLRRHSRLISRPFGLIVDPCNSCQLACPGCIHRKTAQDKSKIDWVPGNLNKDTLDRLLYEFGPYAINTQYFNWGEPLLNKKTPQFIQESRRFLMRTSISTNLSLSFDAEALVASGLDYLILSIDGATAETYGKYRVNGNFDLVLDNITRLVKARKDLKSKTPFIVWQYLLFDHTISEINQAKKLAQERGVDRIDFAEPYDVSMYDPTITKPLNLLPRYNVFNLQIGAGRQSLENAVIDLHPIIEDHWEKSWVSRVDDDYLEGSRPNMKTCQWLYKDMAMDATGRIFPCCFEPLKDPSALFGNILSDINVFNSMHYVISRKYFDSSDVNFLNTACSVCPHQNSIPNINNNHLISYFSFAEYRDCLQKDVVKNICNWND
ncbi:MAG: radical SAM/SPASM domain-containing protein [Spirochaetota bacterium]|jgi:MoaA/NifB/PqqE/SkfB family radical SAM enzyme